MTNYNIVMSTSENVFEKALFILVLTAKGSTPVITKRASIAAIHATSSPASVRALDSHDAGKVAA